MEIRSKYFIVLINIEAMGGNILTAISKRSRRDKADMMEMFLSTDVRGHIN